MKNKVTLKEILASHVIIAILIAVYYWCWARNDWQEYYLSIQNTIGIFAFFLFVSLSIRETKYKKEVKDEMAITNLRKCDSICFKIITILIVCIGFLSAILRYKISSEIIGYMLMGVLVSISLVRVILFCIIDKKGWKNETYN